MPVPAIVPVPEKSIAVLPFENLSTDKDNAFFTDGVQDEILTDLAKVADLKVISRTSVMQYKGDMAARNLREIASQLGVAHIVEGSVQRADNEVRVNAQLIDARTDAHEWAMNYDRPLEHVFAIQSEIAQAIADQLRATISPEEHAAMTQAPTNDVLAFQLYQQAAELETHETDVAAGGILLQAVKLLDQTVARDPQFLSAYCLLARVHLDIYFEGFDHTAARRELAHAAVAQAVRLQPDAGETHLALADYYYHGFSDYDRALAELALAHKTLPNSAQVYNSLGEVHRRQGRWGEAIDEQEKAISLDPRNLETLEETASTLQVVGRFGDAGRLFKQALEIAPGDVYTREQLASVAYLEKGEAQPFRALNALLVAGGRPSDLEDSAYFRLEAAVVANDAAAAKAALATFPAAGSGDTNNFVMPKEWYAGLVARTFGDPAGAFAAFTAARLKVAQTVHDQPDYAEAWSALGLIDAGLGRKDDAIAEGRHACELLPVSKDAFQGPSLPANLAMIYAWTGEKDFAIQEIALVLQMPGAGRICGLAYGNLLHDPQWDSLRGDPRFQALVASLAPGPSH